ncbi:hypothetical protein [Aquabacterium sp. CECT 9606]|uniref:hypothetical protein n=1 Tax=Aquabacterium sp. CECT 9606 TaxID=2845822 RepID=UPI001E5A2B47|nr:hypothetical protein [Aquabacterium sp. CECT 9606]CAH0351062.1 hypothetical protein AQB9606_01905 [Aquabacterium sp. CECT 9606]
MPEMRFLKTKDERLTDTLDYVKANLSTVDWQEMVDEVNKLSANQQSTIGGMLSLGATGSSADRTTNREPRRAKRALMLATRLFLTDPAFLAIELARVKVLPETSEPDLLAEMRSWFTIPGVTPGMVADDALANIASMPNWQNVNVPPSLAVRGQYKQGAAYEFNCYNAVVFWAFQAGAISRRFLFNKLHGQDGNHFFPVFSSCGWLTDIEYKLATPPELVTNKFGTGKWIVPKGMAVYFVTPHKVFGHVALSLGDGRIISQNAVIPAFPDKIKDEDRVAVTEMNHAKTHIIQIKHFWDIHYNPQNGYHKLQHTATGFWEAFLVAER